MEIMKALFLLFITTLISIIDGCAGCNDCGPIGQAEYGLTNSLNKKLELQFYGTKFSSTDYVLDFLELSLEPKDTSDVWVVLPDPVGYTAFEYVFTSGNTNDYFPLETDSVLVKIDNDLVKVFRRISDELQQDYRSIFYWGAYELADNSVNVPLFYKLDSVNLNLK